MARKISTSRRKSDGKPRKLRVAKSLRGIRRQARSMMGMKRGKKLKKQEIVHHSNSPFSNAPKNLKVLSGRKKHGSVHPGVHKKGLG